MEIGSVSTWGQRRAHNLNAPATLYPLESSLQADFPAKASTPKRRNSPQRETLSEIYDVTLPVSPAMPVWPGDPPVTLKMVKRIEDGAKDNLSHLACSVHIGTHVDAPLHFIAGGGDIPSLSLDALIGPATVVALPDAQAITADDFAIEPAAPGEAAAVQDAQ